MNPPTAETRRLDKAKIYSFNMLEIMEEKMRNAIILLAMAILSPSLSNAQDFWQQANGPYIGYIGSLAINPSGHVFAGTAGGGVYRSIPSTTAVKEINKEMPSSFELRQNYPNPFNAATKLVCSIHNSDYVVLKIYDKPGKELQTLINEFQTPGEYDIIFDAQSRSGGIYFYKLMVGSSFVQTKKRILIR